MGRRRDRFDLRATNQAKARSKNAPVKIKERGRRDARMIDILKKSKPPYGRAVRNWLCVQLGKKETQITPADIERLKTGGTK